MVDSLLTGEIAAIVYGAFKDIFLDAVLTRDTPSTNSPDVDRFDPPLPTSTTYACKAIVEMYSQRLRQDGLIKANERKVLILANSISVTPEPDDRITIRGITFTICKDGVGTDPALAVWECRGAF